MWGWEGGGEVCSQPGLEPLSVLVLVFLLVLFNLVVLGRCKSFLEGGKEPEVVRRAGQAEGVDWGRQLGSKGPRSSLPSLAFCDFGWFSSLIRVPKAPSDPTPSGLRARRNGGGPSGPATLAGKGRAHLSGIENANDARDNRAVLTFMFLADELYVSEFAEVEVAFFLQAVHCQLQIQQLLGEKVVFRPEIPASDSPSCSDDPAAAGLSQLPLSTPLTCWLSSRIWASVSWPPFRADGGFFRRMQGGATLLSRPEVCIFLGPVGDVLCGTAQRREVGWGLMSQSSRGTRQPGEMNAGAGPCARQALVPSPPI